MSGTLGCNRGKKICPGIPKDTGAGLWLNKKAGAGYSPKYRSRSSMSRLPMVAQPKARRAASWKAPA